MANVPREFRATTGDAQRLTVPTVLRLQRMVGNHAVERLLAPLRTGGRHAPSAASPHRASLQRKPKAKKKPVTRVYYVNAKGFIAATAAGDRYIGYRRPSGEAFVTAGGVPASDAILGKMVFANGNEVLLLKVERVELGPAPDAPAGTAPDGQELTPQTATFTGDQYGLPFSDGWIPTRVIDLTGKGQPVAPKDLPENFQSKLGAGSRVELEDGRIWVLMAFPTGGPALEALSWAPARESRKSYKAREAMIAAEAEKLPSDLKTEVEKQLKTISLVSLIEGSWGSVSPGSDPMASLGIFQWGMSKKGTSLGSLGNFFKKLKERATAAEAKPKDDRTETEQLYVDAWHQCVAAGLDVTGNQVKINGKVATGGEVEQKMKGEMAKGALKTYQLKGALDWLDELKAKVVRPGAVGQGQIGSGYKDVSSGQAATFTVGQRTIKLTAPADRATVGDVCTTPKGLGAAANLLVNRPAWVELTIWKILAGGDPSTTASDLLAKIVKEQETLEAAQAEAAAKEAASAQAAAGAKPPKSKATSTKPKKPAAIDGTNVADKASFEALRRLVWPKATPMPEAKLMAEFNAQALGLYKAEDEAAKKKGQKRKITYEVRAKRLAVTELPEW